MGQLPMSLKIEYGLFKLDFTDYHAVLGIPVDADVKAVRQRYLQIARRLHPDSCKASTEVEKNQANLLLTRLVNPAYEQLSRGHRDYAASLSHLSKRLGAQGDKISLASATAKQLLQAGANLDNLYRTSVDHLASEQYQALDQALAKIAEISELNLVYLMCKSGKGETVKTPVSTPVKTQATGVTQPNSQTTTGATSQGGSVGPKGVSRVDSYIRRAEGYLVKNNFAAAVLELREALKLDQNNSDCHSLLGIAYLKQNKGTMAKVHINKALQLNPQNERALKAKQLINEFTLKSGGNQSKVSPEAAKGKPSNKSNGGGLFGGLFGGKKK
ncbi:MAG: DnaJ domain-containing protein [Moorea sp. SIO4A5]|nr:DnaJ domain-containing protein [Moorena sp. SIO4A5]